MSRTSNVTKRSVGTSSEPCFVPDQTTSSTATEYSSALSFSVFNVARDVYLFGHNARKAAKAYSNTSSSNTSDHEIKSVHPAISGDYNNQGHEIHVELSRERSFMLTPKRMFIIMSVCGFLVGITTFVIALSIPEDPQIAAMKAEKEYLDSEVALPMFQSALRIEKVAGHDIVWNELMSDLNSKQSATIQESVLPTLQVSFEVEGFSISSIQALSQVPYDVTVYEVMNRTVTSLTWSLPASLNGSDKNTEYKVLGSRKVVRLVFQCLAIPSKNAAFLSLIGPNDLGMVQFMLKNYLASQKVIATVESIEVPQAFKDAIMTAMRIVPRLGRTSVEQPANGEYISCHKAGRQISLPYFLVTCPPDCYVSKDHAVIGTNLYHMDSAVCLAAIHSGVIQASDGGNVEFIEAGDSNQFTGSKQNGINSINLNQYGVKFIVKSPGPSWTRKFNVAPTVGPKTTTEGLQEANKALMLVQFKMLKFDRTPTDYSTLQLGSPLVAITIQRKLETKMRRALLNLHFDPRSVAVVFQPPLSGSASVLVKINVHGGYNANAQGFFPYKPWENSQIKKLMEDIMKIFDTDNILMENPELRMDRSYLSALEIIPSTTIPPVTSYSGACGCGDVFFIQSLGSLKNNPENTKMISMYQKIFDAFQFDQVDSSGEIMTMIGQDTSTGTIRRMSEAMEGIPPHSVDITNEKLWKFIQKLEDQSIFLRKNIGKRNKLLIVMSQFVSGPDAEINLEYVRRLKERGVNIAYVGYNWDVDLLKSYYYPQQYASVPATNFVMHVNNVDKVDEIAAFLTQVIRKYVCDKPPSTCADLSFNIQPPAELTFNLTSAHGYGFTGSYTNGIPNGEGLKAYKRVGGIAYGGVQLSGTLNTRKTEPDERQSFYMNQHCGKQAILPILQSGKIVGGREAIAHSWPWAISINNLKGKRDYYTNVMKYTYSFWKCGGSIVAKRWIVTAAHCFAKGNSLLKETTYQVVVGRHDQRELSTLDGDVFSIKKIVYHPKYDDPTNQYDLALLYLNIPTLFISSTFVRQRDIKYRREVAPVCLPNPDVIPRDKRRCWVVGWGFTSNTAKTDRNKLKQAVQFIESPARCQRVYRKFYYNPNHNICAKRSTVKGNPNLQCRGDSGGPLVCEENGRWVQYGASNFGPRLCESGGEGVYFLLSSALDWLCCYLDKNVGPCAYVKCAFGTT